MKAKKSPDAKPNRIATIERLNESALRHVSGGFIHQTLSSMVSEVIKNFGQALQSAARD